MANANKLREDVFKRISWLCYNNKRSEQNEEHQEIFKRTQKCLSSIEKILNKEVEALNNHHASICVLLILYPALVTKYEILVKQSKSITKMNGKKLYKNKESTSCEEVCKKLSPTFICCKDVGKELWTDFCDTYYTPTNFNFLKNIGIESADDLNCLNPESVEWITNEGGPKKAAQVKIGTAKLFNGIGSQRGIKNLFNKIRKNYSIIDTTFTGPLIKLALKEMRSDYFSKIDTALFHF
jgi:hypothetical protein